MPHFSSFISAQRNTMYLVSRCVRVYIASTTLYFLFKVALFYIQFSMCVHGENHSPSRHTHTHTHTLFSLSKATKKNDAQ